MYVKDVFEDLETLTSNDSGEYNTVQTEHDEYEIEQIGLQAFLEFFMNKSPWREAILNSESSFNKLLRLENLFLVMDNKDEQGYGKSVRINEKVKFGGEIERHGVKIDLVNFKIFALLMCAGEP